MRKQKIYLETTVFNYFFDTDRDANPATVKLFQEIKDGKYDAYTSTVTVVELKRTIDDVKRNNMLNLITQYDIKVIEADDEVNSLAKVYMDEGIIPKTHENDAQHIAIASIHDIKNIISMNFKHINRKKTKELTAYINKREGYSEISIYSSEEVVDHE